MTHATRTDLVDLVARLGRCLDTGDFEGLRAIYSADARVTTAGGTAEGIDALVAQASRNHGDGKVWHSATNHVVEVDGDDATIRANILTAFSDGVADPAPFLLAGVYEFEARRTGEGWRLTSLRATPTWALNSRLPSSTLSA